MTIGIGISWHTTRDSKALANRVVEGSLRLFEGNNDYMSPTLDIYLESPANAAMAAAAINGDMTELRRLLYVSDDDVQHAIRQAEDLRAENRAESAKPDDFKHAEYLRQKAEQI